MRATAYHREVIDWLRSHGATQVDLRDQGRTGHPRIHYTWQGVHRQVLVSRTPSDSKAAMLKIQDLRRELGIVPDSKPPAAEPEVAPYPEGEKIVSQTAEVVKMTKTSTKTTISVPWSEVAPLIERLRSSLGCSQDEAMKMVGYTGTAVASWSRQGTAPTRVKYALIGALADLGIRQEATVVKQFDHAELTDLFGCVAGFAVPEDRRRSLVAKLAAELAR